MSATAVPGSISVEEYLSDPVYERAEWVEGRAIELNVGTKSHGKIQSRASKVFVDYFDSHPAGYVATELRCRLGVAGSVRFRLPDLAVVLADDDEEQLFLDRAPDLAIEIRSPGDSLTELFRKTAEYFSNGSRLVWIVLPEERAVLVCEPARSPQAAVVGQALESPELLPGLKLDVEYLFS